MTDITPTLRQVPKPTLTTLLATFRHDLLKRLNCVKVGVVIDYHVGGANQIPTATVEIAQQQVTSVDESTGIKTLAEYPLLVLVPVAFCGGGGFTATFPVNAGDECIVLFHDRELANWVAVGPGQAPNISNLHDLSDGICLVGIRSDPRALANISATAWQLRSDDYTGPAGAGECIEVEPGRISLIADDVVVHARLKLAQDAGGTGQVTQPGQIDTYTDGVPSNHHNPTPPEVPT